MSIKKLTSKEKFENEIRVFRKNENAIYDMLTLYRYLLDKNDISQIVVCELIEKLISDLEDEEVSIKLKSDKDIFDIIEDINKKHRELKEKYKNNSECKELWDNFYKSYRGNMFCDYFDTLYGRGLTYKVDIITILYYRKMYFFIGMFLLSDIHLREKIDMFSTLLKCVFDDNNILFLCHKLFDRWCKLPKIKQVIDAYSVYNIEELIGYIEKYERYSDIPSLHKWFNLNSEYKYIVARDNEDGSIVVSLVGAVGCKDKSIRNIKELYESDSYMKLPKEIRDNNDLVILESINGIFIEDFIKLSHFEITDEKIDILSNIIISFYKCDDEEYKNLSKKYLNKLSFVILHKAKNKEEYKKMLIHVKKLEEKVKSEIDKKEKEYKCLKEYRSLLTIALKEIETKTENKISNSNLEIPQKLKKVLTVEDLIEKKNN